MRLLSAGCAALLLAAGAEALSAEVKDVRGSMGSDRVIHVENTDLTFEAKNILTEADDFGNTETGSDMRVSFATAAALESAGIPFEDTTETWLSQFEENFNGAAEFVCEDGATACASRANFYASYHRLDAMHAKLQSIADSAPTIASIGSMGQSLEQRDMQLIEITKGSSDKPLVFYFCGIHAREWLPPLHCTHMAEELVKNGGHPLLDKVKFIIAPITNPDGYEFSHTNDNLWRKSRKPNPNSRCVGTDLNRNFDVKWCEEGASSDPCSQTYCGRSAFDNIEVINMKNYYESLISRGEDIFMSFDIHAKGQMWMSPYGYTRALPQAVDYDRMFKCGKAGAAGVKSVNGLDFAVGSIANIIYVVSGGSKDYFYDKKGIVYSYGLEVRGNSFQPPTSQIIPSNAELFVGMVESVECAYNIEYEGGTVPTSPPSTDCEDRVPSGLTYSSGGAAECDEIGRYCSDYEIVRERCPKTCGECKTCSDKQPSGLQYNDGRDAPCSEIGRYCSSYEIVRDACPATCNTCPADLALRQDALLKFTIPDQAVEEEKEGIDEGVLYGALAVAGTGFVGAMAALVTILRRSKKNAVPEALKEPSHYAL